MYCPKCHKTKLNNLMSSNIISDEDEYVDIRKYGYCPKCKRTFTWVRMYVLAHPSMINPYVTNDPPKECNFS